MLKIDISDSQIRYLKAIKEYKDKNDFYPSMRLICRKLNLTSSATIHSAYGRLLKRGYLNKCDRGIYTLTEKAKTILEIIDKLNQIRESE